MNDEEVPTLTAIIHDTLQASAPLFTPQDDPTDDLPDGSMLMGWVVVAEWMSPDGERWLSKIQGAPAHEPSEWQIQGYLHNALNDWPRQGEDE